MEVGLLGLVLTVGASVNGDTRLFVLGLFLTLSVLGGSVVRELFRYPLVSHLFVSIALVVAYIKTDYFPLEELYVMCAYVPEAIRPYVKICDKALSSS